VRSKALRELPSDELPRERLFSRGPASLSNGDLLALLLNTGLQGEPVTAVAQRLLIDHGGLLGLLKLEVSELAAIRGVGPAKASKLKAAFEIANRAQALGTDERPKIASPDDVVNLIGLEMSLLENEQLRTVLLDTKHRVLSIKIVYQGSVNQAQVRVAEVFRDAVRMNATAMIVVHNHPSGDPTPSAPDVALTADLERAGDLLDIELLDHLIIGRGQHVSLRRLGLGFASSRKEGQR
jgi:DNA repair protein RadC